MKRTIRNLAALIVIGVAAGYVRADGVFYERENVPPGIPYQRAFLIYHDGMETLAVQSKFNHAQSSAVDSIGWVVPVPNVPEVASMEPWVASDFFSWSARRTSAEYWRVSILFFIPGVLMLLGGFLLVLFCLAEILPRLWWSLDMDRWSSRLLIGICVTVLGLSLCAMTAPKFVGGRDLDVEVVKAEQVGIYDVNVIRGDDAEPIMAWLTNNGFRFGDPDKTVFADYVSKGWCFVVAKVGVQAKATSLEAEGMAAPLVLIFRADKPIYPMALTATAGSKTEVLLYTMSAHKLACGGRLPLRHADMFKTTGLGNPPLTMSTDEDRSLFDDVPDMRMALCKFRGTLTPDQMKEDLVFEPAPDNKSYHETKIVW